MISSPALMSGPSSAMLPSQARIDTQRILDDETTAQHKKEEASRIAKLRELNISFIDNDSFIESNRLDKESLPQFVRDIETNHNIAAESNSTMPAHLARMCATALLTAEQESLLFRRMNYCKARAATLQETLQRSQKTASQIEDLLLRAERIRNYLTQANTRLVMSIARGFVDARNSFDDLFSQGVTSLLHVVEKFDYSRGYRFSTYATCAVRRDLYRQVMSTKKHGQRYSTGADEALTDCSDHRSELSGISESSWKSLRKTISKMMDQLDERERLIMSARFGFGDQQGKASYSRLGEQLGISKERVRQLANRALEKLGDLAREHRLERLIA